MRLRTGIFTEEKEKLPVQAFAVLELFDGRVRVGVGVPKFPTGLYGVSLVPFVMVRLPRFGW